MARIPERASVNDMLEVLKKQWLDTKDIKILASVSLNKAREIKNKIASAVDRECETALFVSGKSCLDNLPISFEVTSTEIFPYIDEQVNQIIKEIHNEILNVSPDLLADSADNGIILTGGGSLMFDLSKRLSEELDIRCEVVENPCLSKIKGLGILMSDEKLLSNNGYRFIFKDEIKNRK